MSPTKPRRMDGYIRVSRVGARNVESESYITEDVQREKIEAWAKLRDVEIGAWHIDRDQSGSKLTRPGFDACMARIEAGRTEGVVVAQIDRLSRADVADALMIVRRIYDEHGGTVAAVDLGIDPTTEVGEMLLTVLLALARMQWRRYAEAWASAKERAVNRGAHVGLTPAGYARGDDGRLVPDPDTAPIIQEAFRLASTQGLRAAVDQLESLSGTWTTTTARRTIERRTYLGEVRYGDALVNTAAHEPLVDRATWTEANRKISLGPVSRRANGEYPLSPNAVCATCGINLTGQRSGKAVRAYRCARNKYQAVKRGEQEACPAPALVSAAILEEYVHAALLEYAATQKPDTLVTLMESSDDSNLSQAESLVKVAELARDQDARDTRLRTILGDKAFYERMEAHNRAVDEAQASYEEVVAGSQPELVWPLVDEIATAPVEDLPALLERCGVVVKVAPGRGNLPKRVTLAAVSD